MWSFRRLSIWSEPRKLRLRSFSVPRRDQMNVHKNAPLTPKGRESMVRSVVEGGLSKADAAYQFNTTPRTVTKWVKRFRAEGVEGCVIAPPGRIHRRAKPCQPRARPLRLCA